MRALCLILITTVLTASSGCIVTGSDGEKRTTLNLGWLIGGVAMAVDGDDKDDHMHYFEDDDECECKRR